MCRLLSASLLLAILSLLAMPALSQEGEPAPEQVTPVGDVIEPAVVVPAPPDQEAELQWTYKYLVPLGLLVATIAVFVTVVQYFVKVVRSRYQLVE